MSSPEIPVKDGPIQLRPSRNLWKTLLIVLPVFLFSLLLVSHDLQSANSDGNLLRPIALVITFIFMNSIFIMMVKSGQVDKYRSIAFFTYAVCFIISFIPSLIEARGSNTFTSADMLQGKIPFCHIVIPMTLIPAILKRTIIFPGSMLEGFASIASMVVIWIGVSLALGRGFCSWGCFYGGLEDGFSRLLKKPLIKKINPKWRYLSFAILLGVVLSSIATLSPTYCTWLCPFKAVTEYEKISTFLVMIQTVIFVLLFLSLVVIMPVFTKKRTQCSFLCPFGAMQSFTNKINAFEVRIDKDKCIGCKVCVAVCPTFSMDEDDLKAGKTNLTCTKCGKCIGHCPKGAISLEINGTSISHHKGGRIRLFFLYPAFVLLLIMGSGMMQNAIYRILLLITTGKMVH
jgi:polyferredoxin